MCRRRPHHRRTLLLLASWASTTLLLLLLLLLTMRRRKRPWWTVAAASPKPFAHGLPRVVVLLLSNARTSMMSCHSTAANAHGSAVVLVHFDGHHHLIDTTRHYYSSYMVHGGVMVMETEGKSSFAQRPRWHFTGQPFPPLNHPFCRWVLRYRIGEY